MPNSSFCSCRAKAARCSSRRGSAGRSWRHRGRRLRLPMEQRRADRVVAVHRRGGVVGLRLLQGDEEGVDVAVGGVPDTLAEAVRLPREVERGEDLFALVARVDRRGHVGELARRGRRSGDAPRRRRCRRRQRSPRASRAPSRSAASPASYRVVAAAVGPERVEEHSRQALLERARGPRRSAASSAAAAGSRLRGAVVHMGEGADSLEQLLLAARSLGASAGRRHGGAGSTSGCRAEGCR